MSDKLQKIRAALESHLNDWVSVPELAIEGQDFTPSPGALYATVNLLPRRTDNPTLTERLRDDGGIYQIGLYFPRGTDTATCDLLAGSLAAHFEAGTMLEAGIIKVRIEGTPAIAPGLPVGDRWLVPVSIRYRSIN